MFIQIPEISVDKKPWIKEMKLNIKNRQFRLKFYDSSTETEYLVDLAVIEWKPHLHVGFNPSVQLILVGQDCISKDMFNLTFSFDLKAIQINGDYGSKRILESIPYKEFQKLSLLLAQIRH